MKRPSTQPDTVVRCVPRQDGGYLIVTRLGASGSSPFALAEGSRVRVVDGKAVAA
jgi:hypothetical protein